MAFTFYPQKSNRSQKTHRGFSLLEVVLAVGLMGILASVTLTALNPAYFMAKGRNAQRWMDLDSLIDSVTAFTIDNDGYIPPNIQIPPTTSSKAIFSGAYVIDEDVMGAKAIVVDDIDGDGEDEIIGTAAQGNSKDVSLWERSGTAPHFTWTQSTVDSSNWKGVDVAVGDLDGDNRKDIVAVNNQARDIAWWRNLGGTPATFGSRLNIETNYLGVTALALANFDGVNGMDVVAASNNVIGAILKAIQWYDNDGTPLNGGWNTTIIENWVLSSTRQAVAVDIDGDTDQDVVAAENSHLLGSEYLFAYQNDGTPEGANWTRATIDNGENGARGVAVGNIDGDGDTDIVGISLTGQVEWFENDGTPFTGSWPQHTIANSFGGETIVARDLDSDGDTDVIAASNGGDKIAYWENIGAGSFSGTFVIDYGTELDGVSDIAIADIDEDGDQDIVAANNVKRSVSWWMNLQIGGESEPAPQGAIDASYKPVCRADISVVECDAYGGVSLDVLIPGFLAEIPIDPSYRPGGEGTGAVLTGYEISIDTALRKLSVRAPLAELNETIELVGPVGVENCLIWDIVQGERTCVLFE